jgi:CheY-like chemotaxis protein
MPGRDGYGVAEYVKRSPAFVDRTRVVLLTGAFEPIDQARADRLGIDGVLAKPFEPQVAIDLVRRVLSQPPLQPASASAAAATPKTASAPGTGAAPQTGSASSGYPFEPGTTAKSTPAELDEYFQRLDEALASAGHRASSAPAAAPKVKGRPMIEAQHSASTDVTLGDAFSALLAAEQGEPSAAGLPPSAFSASVLVSESAHPQPAAPAPVISEALLESVVRRVLEQMSDRLVRELVGPKVLDVAERLVREEIVRLKAEADALDS